MTTGTRRILADPGGQRPRSDLVAARGSNPRRILLCQRTLSVFPSPAFPSPAFSSPWKVFPGKFSLESFPWKILTLFVAGQTGAASPPKLRNKERS
jgi:hypothetical protein